MDLLVVLLIIIFVVSVLTSLLTTATKFILSKLNNKTHARVKTESQSDSYSKSANQQYALGEKYYYGTDVEQNYKMAVEWYIRAANQGLKEAQCSLGYMFSKGLGIKQDFGTAVFWYNKAAMQGYAKAQYNLGTMYFRGLGVPRDKSKAIELWNKAAAQGNNDAISILQKQIEKPQRTYNQNYDNQMTRDKKASISLAYFNKAKEMKRNGNYYEALRFYKRAYKAFPEDSDLQSTIYAMAKVYLILGDYEKSCTLFQDGLTQLLAQHDQRTSDFYDYYLNSRFKGTFNEYDPRYIEFRRTTDEYSIFIGLTHFMLIDNGRSFLMEFQSDFDEHIKEVSGRGTGAISKEYFDECFQNGWPRTLIIASESMDRCFYKMDSGKVQKRKQEFLDILDTITDN